MIVVDEVQLQPKSSIRKDRLSRLSILMLHRLKCDLEFLSQYLEAPSHLGILMTSKGCHVCF